MSVRLFHHLYLTSLALAACVAVGLGGAAVLAPRIAHAQAADAAPQGDPDALLVLTLVDPASSGSGVVARGTFTYRAQDHQCEVTGAHLSKTPADTPPSVIGMVYRMPNLASANGDYVSFGDPAGGLHYLHNQNGVVVVIGPALTNASNNAGLAGNKLMYRDASTPLTVKILN